MGSEMCIRDSHFLGGILKELESKFDYVAKNVSSRDACIVLTPQPIRDGKVTAARGTSYYWNISHNIVTDLHFQGAILY